MRHLWTEEETAHLRELVSQRSLSRKEIAATLGIDEQRVRARMSWLGLYKNRWTPEEDAKLVAIARDDTHKLSTKEIAAMFGRSEASVKHRATRLGCDQLGRRRVVRYDDESVIAVLRFNTEGKTVKEIAALLPDVGAGSIPQIIRRNGAKTNDPTAYTEEEIEWLRANYATLGSRACGERLNATSPAMARLARKHGIPKGKRQPLPPTVYDEEAICKAYETKTIAEIVRLFRVTGTTVTTILKSHGITVQPYSRFRECQESIVRDYQAGDIPTEEIGKRHGLSGDVVREGLRTLGLYDPTRSGRFANRRSPHECWVAKHGEEEANRRTRERNAKTSQKLQGEGNPMYGKPSPQGAGNGWKGWYRGHYFRSLREAMFMVEMDARGVTWLPGEKGICIPYRFNGSDRTYRPDFIVRNVMYELKPIRLHQTPAVTAKRLAAETYCAAHGMEYHLTDWVIDKGVIKAALDRGDIRFDRDYLERFRAYVG